MRFLVQLADKTSFYLSEKEGKEAMSSWSMGDNIICRKGAFAHYLISSIRPLRVGDELHADCVEQEEMEQRHEEERKLIREGKLKYVIREDNILEEAATKMIESAIKKDH